MGNPPVAPPQQPQFVAPEQNLTFEIVPRHMRIYQLNESDIDSLSSNDNAIALTFFGLSAGVAGSFVSVIIGGSFADAAHRAMCLDLAWSFGALAAFFGIIAIVQTVKARKRKREIKEQTVVRQA
jgi:hypothetical protein